MSKENLTVALVCLFVVVFVFFWGGDLYCIPFYFRDSLFLRFCNKVVLRDVLILRLQEVSQILVTLCTNIEHRT